MVSIFSIRGDISASARIDETLAKGTVFLPFAFYEAAANILTSDQLDPNGKIPEFKHTPVQLSKSRSHRHMSGF
jgi:formate dehydrogenase major subunit